jgi:hypothetical protein
MNKTYYEKSKFGHQGVCARKQRKAKALTHFFG